MLFSAPEVLFVYEMGLFAKNVLFFPLEGCFFLVLFFLPKCTTSPAKILRPEKLDQDCLRSGVWVRRPIKLVQRSRIKIKSLLMAMGNVQFKIYIWLYCTKVLLNIMYIGIVQFLCHLYTVFVLIMAPGLIISDKWNTDY